MFSPQIPRTGLAVTLSLSDRIYHATVRWVRRSHANAMVALLKSILQSVIFVGMFMLMFTILGIRGSAIRGDFMLYIMSGVLLFMTHTKTLVAVSGAEGPASAMMQHGPMSTVVSITSAALGALYIQILSIIVILFFYHAAITPIKIEDPIGALLMLMLAWASGFAIGMLLYSLRPWVPEFATIVTTLYSRANMIFSGKMFLGNSLSFGMLAMFDWNPLFHVIDQTRGYIFGNYFPHNSSVTYPLIVTVSILVVGMMAEFFTRRRASISWTAGR